MERFTEHLLLADGQLVYVSSNQLRDEMPRTAEPLGFWSLRRYFVGPDGEHLREVYPGIHESSLGLNVSIDMHGNPRKDRCFFSNPTEWLNPDDYVITETYDRATVVPVGQTAVPTVPTMQSVVIPGNPPRWVVVNSKSFKRPPRPKGKPWPNIAYEVILLNIIEEITTRRYEPADFDAMAGTLYAAMLARGFDIERSMAETVLRAYIDLLRPPEPPTPETPPWWQPWKWFGRR